MFVTIGAKEYPCEVLELRTINLFGVKNEVARVRSCGRTFEIQADKIRKPLI